MPSYAALGKHLGVSRPRICQLAKMGMPVDSLEAADEWRQCNTISRAPTNGHPTRFKPQKRRARRLRNLPVFQPTGDSLLDLLNQTIHAAECAFALWREAEEAGDTAALIPLTSLCSRTIMTRFKAEKLYREELERRGVLVNQHAVIEKCRRCMDAVLRKLRRLPAQYGAQCGGRDAIQCVEILEDAMSEILTAGRDALSRLDS